MVWCLVLVLGSSCTEEQDLANNAEVQLTFDLTSNSAMKGKITIDDAYLKLDRIQVAGNFGGQNFANVTHTVSAEEPPYRLSNADSSYVSFRLPASPYDQLVFDFYLFQDNYKLVFLESPVQETPAPTPGNNGGTTDPGQGEGNPNHDNDNGGDGGEADPNDGAGEEDNGGSDGDNGGNPGNDTGNDPGDEDGDDGGGKSDDDDDDSDEGDDNDNNGDNDSDNEGNDNSGDDKKKDDKKKDDKKKGDKKNKDNGNKGDDDDDDDDDEDDEDDDDDRKSSNLSNHAIDLGHFFQNAKPALVVFATYSNNNQPVKLIFAVTSLEKFTVHATQEGRENVVITMKNFGKTMFDPEQWFNALSSADIESASRLTYQGQNVLFIHKEYNSNLYETLLSRLQASARIQFSAPPAP